MRLLLKGANTFFKQISLSTYDVLYLIRTLMFCMSNSGVCYSTNVLLCPSGCLASTNWLSVGRKVSAIYV